LHLTHVFPSAIGVVGHYACRSNVDAIWLFDKFTKRRLVWGLSLNLQRS
jgi:hypothetical protein